MLHSAFSAGRLTSVTGPAGVAARCQEPTSARLLDHLVGAREQRGRDCEPERIRRLAVDHQLECGWQQDRKVRRLSPFENPAGIVAELAIDAKLTP
jgi:hypothetical protein